MSGPLSGRTALVTGGAGAIGAACATRLADDGARVIVADVDDAAVAVADAIGGEPWVADLLDVGALEELRLEVDILVNNAGMQAVRPIVDFDPSDFRRMLALMLEVPFLLTRAVLPHMYRQDFGRIINMSSIHGLRASAHKGAYTAAKHGLEGLSKVTAREAGEHGVTSNCVNPGYVRTPLVERQIADQARLHGLAEDRVLDDVLLAGNALKRLVEPDEVASLVGWLASSEAAMVSGASYAMDGGWTC